MVSRADSYRTSRCPQDAHCTISYSVRTERALWFSGVQVVDRIEVEVLLGPAEDRLPRADIKVARIDARYLFLAESLSVG